MSVKENGPAVSRRGFLKGVAVAGTAVATSAAVTKTASAGAPAGAVVDEEKKDVKGYHVTPHILEYYEKARF